ncbi:hypothetical protein [Caproiciproducens faecalis]|uniref:ParB/Sulfiredoxin domain-containing protein n=1 Tax=Caproiciproducens faecalis TaxID=2820301 RepID=A0ABS7DPE7_9FIRM|nr:hypothetical protein [Caproiciproducens faecalis]MBW7573153.1 hypothetical protein [Caproiciproducens faecalis]
MAVKYIEGLQKIQSARFAVVDIEDVYLDEENPRFASSALIADQSEITQSSIINYLVEYGEVSALAQSIELNKGLFNEVLASAYIKEGRIIVLEGNRRVTACKILRDNSLVNAELQQQRPIPTASEETKKNIQKINLIIYDESADAQRYIASKHTQPDVKKWTTIEQYNYYYSQFLKGKKPIQIAAEVSVKDVKKVEDKIRQYILFRNIFNLVKKTDAHLRVETASILPIVSEFMPKLLGNRSKYSLGLEADPISLEYTPLLSKVELYNKILLKVGQAFFQRPEAKKSSELKERPTNDTYRISTDEIKGKEKVTKLIEDNIRIPGLKVFILEFRNEYPPRSEDNPSSRKDIESSSASTLPVKYQVSHSAKLESRGEFPLVPGEKEPLDETSPQAAGTNASGTSPTVKNTEEQKAFTQKEKQLSFFANLHIEHLNPIDPNNQGLIAVAKEIKKISLTLDYTAYTEFPIASVFLLRSLIEQVVARQLKKGTTYSRLVKSKPTPELGYMITEMLKEYNNGNYQDFNNDRQLGQDFNSCFTGLGTKDQLDKVIHRPAECQPNKDFLDNLAKQGLKDLLQKFINSFI